MDQGFGLGLVWGDCSVGGESLSREGTLVPQGQKADGQQFGKDNDWHGTNFEIQRKALLKADKFAKVKSFFTSVTKSPV